MGYIRAEEILPIEVIELILGIGSYFFIKMCKVACDIKVCYSKPQKWKCKKIYEVENKHAST